MQNYKTVEEMAEKWQASLRYVQYLCREGKIDGAIKSAGAWFIPINTPNPLKNTKSHKAGFNFIGTKKKVFDSAVQLFMLKGYENVSIRDISDEVGIRQSAVYNHFKSKQEILDTMYGYCWHYLPKNRPCMEDVESILQNGSLTEIVACVWYAFDESYIQTLTNIIRIVYQRCFTDDNAKKIIKSLIVDEGIRFAEDVYNRAVEIGRLAPFDTHAMSVFVNSIRIYSLQNWIVDESPANMMQVRKDEQILYEYAGRLLTDLKLSA